MKPFSLTLFLLLSATIISAQTAVNFTAKDCAGVSHELFNELDSGKVVVLCWVMPCGSCVPASQTTGNVVQSYQEANPGKVLLYLVDDLANTSCASLISWGNNNHVIPTASFSNSSISMLDYGTTGMPKVVVLGGTNHHVFMIADYEVDPTALQESINAAIITAGISEEGHPAFSAKVIPNPANSQMLLSLNSKKDILLKVELFSIKGEYLGTLFNGTVVHGEFGININLSDYPEGMYFIRLNGDNSSSKIKFTVKH
jgi:hypothetical protein